MAVSAITPEQFVQRDGQDIGTSDWFEVTQEVIDKFADATGDHQFIHVDPERAKATPFGSTIAHGFLTLSLMPVMAYSVLPPVESTKMGVNYGFDKVRLMAPVKSGKRIRSNFKVKEAKERGKGILQAVYDVTVEIEGEDKPALKAEWITLTYV
ncbi:nodulation protein NodN [Pacificimonas flava]|uniref:Nodulation protein NodN n=2 Tax=Pacificimonas TaxID=1960290 RepID=A0A219B7D1_9SPHN|nr:MULTISPECIES: MaoC family dehydratase [Pacificimonas]MBZ6378395.1 MaoC family dehydratase [Pacificimonas aurantium]OWV34302.1 nodulation protein NodN [Pacificimonas flava]